MLRKCYLQVNIKTLYICHVKFLIKIFSIYILLLPCIACTDVNECVDTLKISSYQQPSENHHEEEACNPFCNCACCGHVVSPNSINNEIIVTGFLFPKKQNFFYNSISLSFDFYGNIWQPPKIG